MTARHQALIAVSVMLLLAALAVTGLGARRSSPSSAFERTTRLAPAAQQLPVPAGAAQATRTTRRHLAMPASSWVEATSAATGIPAPAVRAYGAAALTVATEQPRCHLGWNTLAGIGAIESLHGTIGGRTVLPDGRSSTPVVGPALRGADGFAALSPALWSIPIHGDRQFDHAVGPLQFISATWRIWGADGDADGRADPLDLDDSALAAGRYLCADAHDLKTAGGWHAAVLSYNHSETYVRSVLVAANDVAAEGQG